MEKAKFSEKQYSAVYTYCFWKTAFLELLLFQKTLPSIAATFSEEVLFTTYFFRRVTPLIIIPASIYLLKVNNRNTRTRCEICSKLTIKILEPEYQNTRIPEFATTDLVLTVTLSIYCLVIDLTGVTGVFRLKLPGSAWKTKILHQICFFRGALKRTIYQTI